MHVTKLNYDPPSLVCFILTNACYKVELWPALSCMFYHN